MNEAAYSLKQITKILYLTLDDVKSLGFSDYDYFNCTADIFVQHGLGKAGVISSAAAGPTPDTRFNFASGWVEKTATSGVKWSAELPPGNSLQINSSSGVIILSDNATGLPKAIMDAYYISSRCCAATYAVYARYYADKEAESISLIGTGDQSKHNVSAVRLVLDRLDTVKIYDPEKNRTEKLVKELAEQFPGRVLICRTLEEALNDTSMLLIEKSIGVTVKKIPDHMLPGRGVFIAASDISILDEKTLNRMDKIIIDGIDETVMKCRVYASQGEVSINAKRGRENAEENILALNKGLVVQEIYVGSKMYELALEKGIGKELDPITW